MNIAALISKHKNMCLTDAEVGQLIVELERLILHIATGDYKWDAQEDDIRRLTAERDRYELALVSILSVEGLDADQLEAITDIANAALATD